MKNELLISGVILSSQDIKEIQALLHTDETEVHVLETKEQGIPDLVQVVFNDFSAVSFARDLLVGKALELTYTSIKRVIQYLLRKCEVHYLCIEKDCLTEDQIPFRLYVVARTDQFDQLLKELDKIPAEQLLPQSSNATIMVRYDDQGRLEITDMGR